MPVLLQQPFHASPQGGIVSANVVEISGISGVSEWAAELVGLAAQCLANLRDLSWWLDALLGGAARHERKSSR